MMDKNDASQGRIMMAQPQSTQSALTFLSRASRSEMTGKISVFARDAHQCKVGTGTDVHAIVYPAPRDEYPSSVMVLVSSQQSTLSTLLSQILLFCCGKRGSPLALPLLRPHLRDIPSIVGKILSESLVLQLDRVLVDPRQEPDDACAEQAQAAGHKEWILTSFDLGTSQHMS